MESGEPTAEVTPTMLHDDYYQDRKWCALCDEYVPYLRSETQSYCVSCGAPVRLFSAEDHRSFQAAVRRMPRPFVLRDPADQDRA